MNKMSATDYSLFTTIAKMSQKTLLKSLAKFLTKYYDEKKIIITKNYILCKGESPVMLVAHLDTVFKTPPENIFYDQKQHVMWSPQGLGADDRAGVFAIMKIIQQGFRPHICFTTEEEKGGIGASILVKENPKAPFDIKYIIQLDRQGVSDCVFYYCANNDFEEYVEKFNFVTDWGTFSDISIICPAWGIAGVNLSVGYLNEHSKIETLHTDALYTTIRKVGDMIFDSCVNDVPFFEYVELAYDRYWKQIGKIYGWDNYLYDYDYYDDPCGYMDCYPIHEVGPIQCSKCNRKFTENDIFSVKTEDGTRKNYCIDCVSTNVNWCDKCNEPFEAKDVKELYCKDCRPKKINKKVM